jgi:predicted dehydrogenase
MSLPVAVGVLGVGALGQHHARVYASLPEARLVGIHDKDGERARAVAEKHGTRVFDDPAELLAACTAVSVAVPTVDHHAVARRALEAGVDVLVEKPITSTLEQADDLIGLAARHGRVLQVGHIERFNPVVEVLQREAGKPRFVEVHRLGSFSMRSLDIDVVLDLMVHDLDIVLALDGTEPVQIEAVGVPVLTPRVDIANARLRFASGLIANLTASRVSLEKVRKFRVFAPRTYVSVDFAAREAAVYHLEDGPDGQPDIRHERMSAPDQEPLRRQLEHFLARVQDRREPLVAGVDGRRALWLAHQILERIAAGLEPPLTP